MSALLAASRPVRRDMARHPWRILAAVLLIALPVLVGAGLSTWRASEDAATRLDTTRTQVFLQGGTCRQNVDATQFECSGGETAGSEPVQQLIESHLPEGFTATPELLAWGSISTGERTVDTSLRQLAPHTPRAPQPGQVLLSAVHAELLRVAEGDLLTFRLHQDGDPVNLTVAGIVPGHLSLVTEPTLVDPASLLPGDPVTPSAWHVAGPERVTWQDVRALNEAGFIVRSQDVIDDPPPAAQVDAPGTRDESRLSLPAGDELYLIAVMIAGALTILLLGTFIIAPVFTIATSRMSRIFALMSAQGATPWHIRAAVLSYGFIAGLVGATLGAAVGVGGAVVLWLFRFPDWPVSIAWSTVLVLWAAAVAVSTAAALLPAVVASRASISAGMQGASPGRLLRGRPWMAVGPVGLVVIALLALWTGDEARETSIPLFALAVVVALAASAPGLVWALGRSGRRAPLATRLALRDLGRHSLRSVPALAAVMTVLTVAVTGLVGGQAHEAREQFLHERTYRGQQVIITPPVTGERMTVPVPGDRADLYGSWLLYRGHEAVEVLQTDGRPAGDHVPGWGARTGAGVIEATPEILDLLVLDPPALSDARAALSGPALLTNSRTTAREMTVQAVTTERDDEEPTVRAELTVPVVPVLPELSDDILATPDVFRELGVTPEYLGTVLSQSEPLTWSGQQDLRNQVTEGAPGSGVAFTPKGWHSPWYRPVAAGALGLGVLVVITLVLVLSWQDARRQFALLDAVGAPPSLPSRVSGATAGLLALAGTSVAIVVGHAGAALAGSRTVHSASGEVVRTGTAQFVSPDWVLVGILGVAVPLAAWIIGSLVHRRSGDVEYRET